MGQKTSEYQGVNARGSIVALEFWMMAARAELGVHPCPVPFSRPHRPVVELLAFGGSTALGYMMLKVSRVLLLVLSVSILAGAQTPPQKKDPLPDKFMNLKVLPQDISKPDLVNTMKTFTQSLGVRCNFCHVGQGNDLSTYDFMSDEKEHKQVARVMLQMVRDINQNHLAKVSEGDKKPPQITCWTCHRGEEEPQVRMPAKTAGQPSVPKTHKHSQ